MCVSYVHIFGTCTYTHHITEVHEKYLCMFRIINPKVIICFFCVCVCTHVHTCVCVYVCFRGRGRPAIFLYCFSPYFIFWDKTLSLTWSLPFQLHWLATEALGSFCLHPIPELMLQPSYMVLGIWTQVLVLAQWALCPLCYLPSPGHTPHCLNSGILG